MVVVHPDPRDLFCELSFENRPYKFTTVHRRTIRRHEQHSDLCKVQIVAHVVRPVAAMIVSYDYHVLNWTRNGLHELLQELSDRLFVRFACHGRYPVDLVISSANGADNSSVSSSF